MREPGARPGYIQSMGRGSATRLPLPIARPSTQLRTRWREAAPGVWTHRRADGIVLAAQPLPGRRHPFLITYGKPTDLIPMYVPLDRALRFARPADLLDRDPGINSLLDELAGLPRLVTAPPGNEPYALTAALEGAPAVRTVLIRLDPSTVLISIPGHVGDPARPAHLGLHLASRRTRWGCRPLIGICPHETLLPAALMARRPSAPPEAWRLDDRGALLEHADLRVRVSAERSRQSYDITLVASRPVVNGLAFMRDGSREDTFVLRMRMSPRARRCPCGAATDCIHRDIIARLY